MIGYYVHHHGRGHLSRARCVAEASAEPVTVLSSLARPAAPGPFSDWVTLTRDDEEVAPTDVTAGGGLHFAPLYSPGYRQRMQQLADWVRRAEPSVMVVDVSVEVTAFVRLLGIPVVVMAGPGRRDDAPHALGYQLATRIVAPWAEPVYAPSHLAPHAVKTAYVGAFSRFDARQPQPSPGRRAVAVIFGEGGTAVSRSEIAAAAAATPDWTWQAYGGDQLPWTDDVWSALQEADVVVSHGGQNAVAEVAAARRPAVLIPQPRPFREQEKTAAALHAAGLAVVRTRWPAAADWPALLAEACTLDGNAWKIWNAGNGAELAAAAVRDLHV